MRVFAVIVVVFCGAAFGTDAALAVPPVATFSDGVWRHVEGATAAAVRPVQWIFEALPMLTNEFAKAEGLTPKQVDGKYAATGQIWCDGQQKGSASIVEPGNIAISAEHVFALGKLDPASCIFRTVVFNGPIQFSFSIAGRGADGVIVDDPWDDWIVLKLNGTVPPEVKPYVLAIPVTHPEDKYLAVNGFGTDVFDYSKSGNDIRARYFSVCHNLWHHNYGAVTALLTTDCSDSPGSSGSALLDQNGALIGIAADETENQDLLKQKLNAAVADPQNHPFEPYKCHAALDACDADYVPITQAIIDAVARAAQAQ